MDNLIKEKRRFCLGDLHGELDKLKECLQLVNFDYEIDELIQIGDICDRGPDVYGCVEELKKIKNLICLRGNHDEEWLYYLKEGLLGMTGQGAEETLLSYTNIGLAPHVHLDFFKNQKKYYIDEDNNLFVHAGITRNRKITEQHELTLYWDRSMFKEAINAERINGKTEDVRDHVQFKTEENFAKIFIGHTPTLHWGIETPFKAMNVINVDTGCGKGPFPLSIMNIDTEEFWQSKK